MPITVLDGETFRARFPEFDGVPDSRLYLELEEAEADLDHARFGDTLKRAVAFLTAHRLALSTDPDGNPDGSGQAGALQSATVDGVMSTYVTPEGLSPSDLAYHSTVYGQRFLELRNRVTAGPICVR